MKTMKMEYVELQVDVINVVVEEGYAATGSGHVGDGDIIYF